MPEATARALDRKAADEQYTVDQLRVEWRHFSGFKPDLTPAELAARLRVSERTVQRAIGAAS